jgi:2-methylisocitrate lyase-like PEP mutase family enzyme
LRRGSGTGLRQIDDKARNGGTEGEERMSNSDQAAKAERFAAMHRQDGIFVLPNCWDVASACVLADAGFAAIATTSGGCAFSLGYCDGENIPRDEMLGAVQRIAKGVSIAVSADMEAGYGQSPEAVAETVRLAIEAGAVGINIEDSDKSGPRQLLDLELSVERIIAAAGAVKASGMDIVINARTDGYMMGKDDAVFEETVRRANAYLDAGAGCTFVMGAREGDLIARLATVINGPLNILAGPGTPPVAELGEMGVKRVTVGGNIAKAALSLVRRAADELAGPGTYGFAEGAYTQPEIHRIMKGE